MAIKEERAGKSLVTLAEVYVPVSDGARGSSVKCRVESGEREGEGDRKALAECSNDWKSFRRSA